MPSSKAPERAPPVLAALIVVVGVANLNLSVQRRPSSIGRCVRCLQTALNLIAVGYSLGLAASVLYLGAVGDRYGSPDVDPRHPAVCAACPAAAWPRLGAGSGLAIAGCLPDGYLDDAGVDHGVVRFRADEVDRPVVSARRGHRLGQPLAAGWLLGQFWWGSVFLITSCSRSWPADGGAGARVNTSRANSSTTSAASSSVVLVAGLVLSITLAPVPARAPRRRTG